jgi:hypothetical protein
MNLVFLVVVCEGEEKLARDAIASLKWSCEGHQAELVLLDDGSPSRVGRNLEKWASSLGLRARTVELPKSKGFRGSAYRAFLALSEVAKSGLDCDLVVKIDADALVLRRDLGDFLAGACPDRRGLFGVEKTMRWRDGVLFAADQLPLGFTRDEHDGVIQRKWRFGRTRPVWWSDIGRAAVRQGFKFRFVPGCFWFLGGDTLRALQTSGYLERDQHPFGFVFNDDLLLTAAVLAVGHPTIDVATLSPGWRGTMSMTEDMPLEAVVAVNPFVIHPLKDRPAAWTRREDLRLRLLDAADQAASRAPEPSE